MLTGASTGIGRATALLLARQGYRVYGTSRNPDMAAPIPGVTFLPLEIQSSASIAACVQCVLDQAGRIDVLINNAGAIGPASACEETGLQRVRDLFEVNFFGIVQLTSAVLPVMRRQGGGTIVNVSSTGGMISTPPFFACYAASKHALEGYSEALRYEVLPFSIHVAMVEPGYTSTAIDQNIQPPDHPIPEYAVARSRVTSIDRAGIRYGSPPESVARVILRVIRQKRPALRNLTGSDSVALVLASRILPEAWFEKLVAWMFIAWNPPGTEMGTGQPQKAEYEIPTPRELGLRRFLFHRSTRNATLGAAALLVGVGASAAAFWINRTKRSR